MAALFHLVLALFGGAFLLRGCGADDVSASAMKASEDALAHEIRSEAQALFPWLQALRRQLHQHPETMYEEVETSRLVQETLQSLGIPFRAGIAGTGA